MPRPTNMKQKHASECLYVTSLAKWGKSERSCSRIWSLTVLCERDS